jgi:hypothetical protein
LSTFPDVIGCPDQKKLPVAERGLRCLVPESSPRKRAPSEQHNHRIMEEM